MIAIAPPCYALFPKKEDSETRMVPSFRPIKYSAPPEAPKLS